MIIGISGGAGFIGSNLAERLSKSNHEIHIFDNLHTGSLDNFSSDDIEFCHGDLRDEKSIERFVVDRNIEYFVHLGALGSVPRSINEPRLSFDCNAIATLNILEVLKSRNIPILFSSSSSVYGSNPSKQKSENDWLAPISPYAASKLASEVMINAYHESFGVKSNIFRLFNVYGPRQSLNGSYAAVIPKWITAACKKEPLVVYGDGEQSRDFTFVDDVTKVMQQTIESELNLVSPVNLAFGKSIKLNAILEIFKKYFGPIDIEYHERRLGDIENSSSKTDRLLTIFPNLEQITSIEEGLTRTFEWYVKRI